MVSAWARPRVARTPLANCPKALAGAMMSCTRQILWQPGAFAFWGKMLREFRGRRRRIISQGRGEGLPGRRRASMIGSRPGWYRDRHEGVAVVCQVFLGYGLQPASGFGLVARTLPRKLVAPLVVLAAPPASLEATRRMPGRSVGLGSVPSKTSLLDRQSQTHFT